MEELVNAIEAVVPGISVALPSSEPNSGFETEQRLATQIGELWSSHTQAQAAAVQSKEYLSEIRHQLGERLCEVKKLVARPGRGGGWSAFLAAQGIPRASADRYVQRYEKTLHPDSNCLHESIDSTELAVRRLFAAVWPRLRRVITSKAALDLFIHELTVAYDEGAVNQCEKGIASPPAPQPALEPVGTGPERVAELSSRAHDPIWGNIAIRPDVPRWPYADGCALHALQLKLREVEHLSTPALMIQGASDFCDAPKESEGLEEFFRGDYRRLLLDDIAHFPQR